VSEKAKARPRAYRVVAAKDARRGETYTVEIDDGTRPVAKIKGFRTKEAAEAWVAEEEQDSRAAGGTKARP
jgi:hypothetical protein